MSRHRIRGAILLTVSTLFPALAHAQAGRSGPTFSLGGTTVPVEQPDVAHDSVNDRYLHVAGKSFIEGHLLNSTGGIISTFRVNEGAEYAQSPRVAFGADIAGGGGYLVTWHASVANYAAVRGRIIKADGSPLTGDFTISTGAVSPGTQSNWTMGAAVVYATGSQEFLVAWMGNYQSTNDIFFQRVSPSGVLLGTFGLVSAGTPDWERDPSVTYNPTTDEFYIAFAGFLDAGAYGYAAGRRVKAGTGAMVGGVQQFGAAAATYASAVTFNTNTNQYLLGWYHLTRAGKAIYGVVLNGSDGIQVGDIRVLSPYYSAYDALDIDYNAASGQYLLVTHGAGALTWEDAAVSILANGYAFDNGFIVTNTTDVRPLRANPASTEGNFNPRMATSTSEKKWLIVTSSNFAATHAQFAATDAVGGGGPPPPPPPPPPPSCTIAISDTSTGIPGAAYTGALTVTTGAGCDWSAIAQAPWLSVSASSGSGPGSFQWTAQPNGTGASRSGTILVAGATSSRTLTVNQAALVARLGDFNADSYIDLVWQNQSAGHLALWKMTGFNMMSGDPLNPALVADTGWKIVAAPDIDNDRATDLLWQHDAGYLAVWRMRGDTMVSGDLITQTPLSDTRWRVVGAGDIDGDGHADVLWQHRDGRVAVWYMRGATFLSGEVIAESLSDQAWRVVGLADMNGDGHLDLVWHHSTAGQVAVWLMNRMRLVDARLLNDSAPDTNWQLRGLGDFDADGDVDVLWQNDVTGALAAWVMNGLSVQNGLFLNMTVPDTNWKIVAPR